MKWHTPPEPNIPPELLAWAQNPLLARLLAQRGILSVAAARAFTDSAAYRPAPPADLPDMDMAVSLLRDAIAAQTPILVWGDFDVDGQTSTAVLVSILRRFGADVRYHVPHRLTEGHGIRPENLAEELRAGAKLIITCDTGIAAHDAVAAVHAAGAQIIITDHHDLPDTLPPADAVINPKRLPADHPLRELPGVGVAFKVAQALVERFKVQSSKFKVELPEAPDRILESLLDLVALGIVADVAVQSGDTRYLLQRGLETLRRADRLGVRALCDMSNLQPETLTAEHIGFWLAPRLNALGRLGNATQGVELLTTTDWGRARILVAQLDALNDRRKLMVDRTVVQALGMLADAPSLAEQNAIVLAARDWHPGVLGLACSRLVGQLHKPVILLTRRDGRLRGSARSIAGCDIHRAIKTQSELLDAFGGHPMAAGLALAENRLTDFRRGVSAALADCVAQFQPELTIDAVVNLADLNAELLATVRKLAPFGAGNPPVTLTVNDVRVETATIFGRTRAHRRVTVADAAGDTAQLIWWNSADTPPPDGTFDVALTIARDDFRGGDVQLVWQDARLRQKSIARPQRHIEDWRTAENPRQLLNLPDAIFWTSEKLPGAARLTRLETLSPPLKTLVIWQSPPGDDLLRDMISRVQPENVLVVARLSALDTPSAFLAHLMGLIKFALAHDAGQLAIANIAAAMVHRETTVRLALDWLVARGKLRAIARTDDMMVVRADNAPPRSDAADLQTALRDLLAETAAYRTFFRTAQIDALFSDFPQVSYNVR